MSMYKDIVEKFKYYQKDIIERFIDQGIYPSDALIKQYIDYIDLSLPILEKAFVYSGEHFDAEMYNRTIKAIYDDFSILYGITNELTIARYIKLKAYADVHLTELEKKTNDCVIRSKEEINSTSLGETLLFATSFNKKQTNNTTVLSLGNIQVTHGSKIACFITGNNLDQTDIIFTLTEGKNVQRLSPYNLTGDTLVEPHESIYKTYPYKANVSYASGLIPISGLEVDKRNEYYILAGKDKIMVKQFGETTNQSFIDAPLGFNLMGFNEKTYIDFYVFNGKNITFRMNKAPVTSNFPIKNTIIDLNKKIEHFFIECDPDFAFDFIAEKGAVYAACEKGIIKENKLYFPKIRDIDNYLVVERDKTSKATYQVNCELINNSGQTNQIESIYIKELIE